MSTRGDVPPDVAGPRRPVADLERPADRPPDLVGQPGDGRLDAGPGLEQLARDVGLGRVQDGHDRGRQVIGVDEVAGLLAVAVDLIGSPARAARSQAATTLRLWSEYGP